LAQSKIDELTHQLETLQKPDTVEVTPPEILDHIAKLEAELKKMTRQRDTLSEYCERLGEELVTNRDANKARREQEQYEYKINNKVEKSTEELGRYMNHFLGMLPSPIETEVLTGDSWRRIDHIELMAQRVLGEITNVKKAAGKIIDPSNVQSIAVVDAD
jgi:YbbR domain-containing protein